VNGYKMKVIFFSICTIIPALLSVILSRISAKRLRTNSLIGLSRQPLTIFLISRLIYWIGFGMLTAAFLLAILQFRTGGQAAREMIARSVRTPDGAANIILSEMSNFLLPVIFISLFIAVLALGIIGRKVITMLPQDKSPSEEFTRFRFTFVLMALSLIIPPLMFGSLLLV
jgi:hypothetical protein